MAPAILALAQLAPAVMGLFTKNETAGKATAAVSSVARALTGQDSDEGALAALQADPKLLVEYQQAMNAQAVAMYQEETKRLESVNATMRAEISSGDPYVRRARPTFIYAMAASWTLQMLAFSIAIVIAPEKAGPLITAAAGLTGMWSVALAVIGVAVHSRSKDKQVAAGQTPTGILSGLFGKK